jgi:hypothetical protein
MSVEPRHTGEDLPLHSTRQIDAVCAEIEASLNLADGMAIAVSRPCRGTRTKLLITELALLALGQLPTPVYMPPEQARGEAANVDGRSDMY